MIAIFHFVNDMTVHFPLCLVSQPIPPYDYDNPHPVCSGFLSMVAIDREKLRSKSPPIRPEDPLPLARIKPDQGEGIPRGMGAAAAPIAKFKICNNSVIKFQFGKIYLPMYSMQIGDGRIYEHVVINTYGSG
ncbi:hypothetical protein GWI33_021884 [Rhynchophorus ferrugineus]|uniref:Uncharacterized protein n=1 Tax=Rhynchophorus ferrugineus TaxID=354439 RepID=A0A834ITB0_RHYFE|nr:hypothetical protein GWI33_021884 [Rhynchophorus ferrugineus]